jgi:Kef-type K+ transport system membrane component KefB
MHVLAQTPVAVPALKADFVLGFVLLDITLILIAAFAFGALARRLGQPTVVGHIIAGVVLGPTLLGPTLFTWGQPWNWLHCDVSLAATQGVPSIGNCVFPPQARAVLGVIGQIALIFYMFLIGIELDYTMLKGKARGIGTVATGVVVIPMGLGLLVGPALYNSKFVGGFGTPDQPSKMAFSLMVGAMLAVTAFPVMAHILQEKGLSRSLMGSVSIASTATLSVLMFLAVAAAASVARDNGAAEIIRTFVIAGVYVAVMFLVVKPLLRPLGRRAEELGTVSPNLFAIIFIVVFASSYAADRIGINVIPGAFIAGAVLPARDLIFAEMRTKLRDITLWVLLPVFLAFSGLNTDFTKLGKSFILGIAVFLVAGIVGKWVGGAVSARAGGLSWAEGNTIGVLMNCRGLLVLVVALIALNTGVISPALQVGAVLMALITTSMTGPLFDKTLPAALAAIDAREGRTPEVDATTPTVAEEEPVG